MFRFLPSSLIAFFLIVSLAVPYPALAFLDFGGWVTNVPGSGGQMSAGAASGWIYPPCINGVQEVNIRPVTSSPTVMLQFMGAYTFQYGPASFPNQAVIGKYLPAMVCIALYVTVCGLSPCVIPLPFFFAPLIIFNGSSASPAI